jgi:hypothetical protein
LQAKMRRTALLTLVALALAGCGGGGELSKSDYEQHLQQDGRRLAAPRAALSRANSKEEFLKGIDGLQEALNKVADDLDGITPPADVQSATGRLVDAFGKLAGDLEPVKAAADKGPAAARQKFRQATTGAASREANQAITEIERRGYDAGRLGRS